MLQNEARKNHVNEEKYGGWNCMIMYYSKSPSINNVNFDAFIHFPYAYGPIPRAINIRSLLSALYASNPPLKSLNLKFAVPGVLTTMGPMSSPSLCRDVSSIFHGPSSVLGSTVQPPALHQTSTLPKPSSITTMMLRLVRASVRSGVGDRLRSWACLRRYRASEKGVGHCLVAGL